MYKDISGRSRKTIRRTACRGIPMAPRLAPHSRWESAGKGWGWSQHPSHWHWQLRALWARGMHSGGRARYTAHIPKTYTQAVLWPLKLPQEGVSCLPYHQLFLFYSLCESKGAPLAHRVVTKDRSSSKPRASVLKSIPHVIYFALALNFSEWAFP